MFSLKPVNELRRSEITSIFDKNATLEKKENHYVLTVKKQQRWECLLTELPLTVVTCKLLKELNINHVMTYVQPEQSERCKLRFECYESLGPEEDPAKVVNTTTILTSFFLALEPQDHRPKFFECLAPGQETSFFFGPPEYLDLLASYEPDFAFQWSPEFDPTQPDADAGIKNSLADIMRYNQASDGEWCKIRWRHGGNALLST